MGMTGLATTAAALCVILCGSVCETVTIESGV